MPRSTHHSGTALDHGLLHDLLGHLLRHAFNKGQTVFSEVFHSDQITPMQFMMVELIARNPDITHSQICSAMGTSASVVTTSLKPLISQGRIVHKTNAGDKRRVSYRLTAAGTGWFSKLRPKISLCEDQFAAALTPVQRTELAGMLRLLAGLDQPDDTQ